MGSLDDKLSDILDDWYPGAQYKDVVPKIKQAFIDEGWKEPPKVKTPCDTCGMESSVIVLTPQGEENKKLCYRHYEECKS